MEKPQRKPSPGIKRPKLNVQTTIPRETTTKIEVNQQKLTSKESPKHITTLEETTKFIKQTNNPRETTTTKAIKSKNKKTMLTETSSFIKSHLYENTQTNQYTKKTVQKQKRQQNIVMIKGAFIFLFFAVVSIVIKLAIFDREAYRAETLSNMNQKERAIEAPRGIITDRNGRRLAMSLLTYNIILSPYQIVNYVSEEEQEKLYETVEEATGVPAVQLRKTVNEKLAQNPRSQWYQVAQKIELNQEMVDALNRLGGVTAEKTYKRNYPNNELAAHVLGFYNKADKGQYGIEEGYDDYLTGQAGRSYMQVKDSKIMNSEYIEPKQGATVHLTIDQVVQQYATDTMKKYIDQYKPTNASCIIMEPNTGEILAMYSYPDYDPNTYNNLATQLGEDAWNCMSSEEQAQALYSAWKNYSIQFNYEPGSTFKPLVVAMALQEGAIALNDTYYCSGAKNVADRTIHCWKTEGGHGYQTLSDALANSCNVAMMDIAEKLDSDIFLKYLSDFGFGEQTGIELAGEEKGILYTDLGPVDKATSSIGQTFMVTPIQLITAFSSIINGGYLMEPYVVSEIIDENNAILVNHKQVTKRQVLSSNIANTIRNDLKKVVDEGTGTSASISGYNVGGKTGTGQKFEEGTQNRIEDRYVVSFMGFAPVDDPKVVALIVFDDLPENTGAPASAFKDMMTDIFPYLMIEMNLNRDEDKVTIVPEVRGKSLYEATALLKEEGFEYQILGNGVTISEQYPEAGAKWDKTGTVMLYTTTQAPENLIAVPNLSGMTLQEAQIAVNNNFTIEARGEGKIVEQIPKAGSKIEKDNKIIVQLAEP